MLLESFFDEGHRLSGPVQDRIDAGEIVIGIRVAKLPRPADFLFSIPIELVSEIGIVRLASKIDEASSPIEPNLVVFLVLPRGEPEKLDRFLIMVRFQCDVAPFEIANGQVAMDMEKIGVDQ